MIVQKGVIYESNASSGTRNKDSYKKQKHHTAVGGLNGDSGVGQALEFPSRPSRFSYQSSGVNRQKNYPLRFISNLLIIIAIGGFLAQYGPVIRVEIGYRLSRLTTVRAEEEIDPAKPTNGFAENLSKTLIGESEGVPDPNFSIIIPKIHAKAKIIPNVDPANYDAYMAALKTGVAHAAGTQFPGSTGNIYLFAHSTDDILNVANYNAVFYLLRELEIGDEVNVYFAGAKHRYTVNDKQIIDPTDVSHLTPTNAENLERLILQTCWPPGTTIKRMLIFAEKKKIVTPE